MDGRQPVPHVVDSIEQDTRRSSALAYWRYAHEYLRAARALSAQLRLPSVESQPLYHLCAQAVEFALKAFLRACGVGPREIVERYGRAIDRALQACLRQGLPPLPGAELAAVRRLAAHHGPQGFVVYGAHDAATDLDAGCNAVCWILEVTVPVVAEDYVLHYAEPGSPSIEVFIARLRADLSATRSAQVLAA